MACQCPSAPSQYAHRRTGVCLSLQPRMRRRTTVLRSTSLAGTMLKQPASGHTKIPYTNYQIPLQCTWLGLRQPGPCPIPLLASQVTSCYAAAGCPFLGAWRRHSPACHSHGPLKWPLDGSSSSSRQSQGGTHAHQQTVRTQRTRPPLRVAPSSLQHCLKRKTACAHT